MGLSSAKTTALWADFRLTHYDQIERWWEVVSSAYLMVSLQFNGLDSSIAQEADLGSIRIARISLDSIVAGAKYQVGSIDGGNLQLIIQPYLY